ncbi:MAG: nitroreductase family protein [Gammaproteobacteria bacterium]
MNSPGFIGRATRHGRASAEFHDRFPPGPVEAVLGDTAAEALALAALAPSSHNVQPWLVLAHSPDRWSLALAEDRRLPVVDPADHEALVSLGAFLENLVVAGAGLGLDVTITAFGESPDDPDLVRLNIRGGAPARPAVLESIRSRRTLRTPFSRAPLAPKDLEALCADIPGVSWIPAGDPAGVAIRDAVVGAVAQQVSREDAQAELGQWLRWSPADIASRRDGLGSTDLGLRGLGAWFAGTFFDQDTPASALFRRQAVARARKLTRHCGGWLLVNAAEPGVAGSVRAGRAFEQLFLRARSLGVGLHPMSQPLEEPGWCRDLESTLGVDGYPRMLLRTGYTEHYPPAAAVRLPPEAFTRILFSPLTPGHGRSRPS